MKHRELFSKYLTRQIFHDFKNKLYTLIKRKFNIEIRDVYSSYKVGNYFNNKAYVPFHLQLKWCTNIYAHMTWAVLTFVRLHATSHDTIRAKIEQANRSSKVTLRIAQHALTSNTMKTLNFYANAKQIIYARFTKHFLLSNWI